MAEASGDVAAHVEAWRRARPRRLDGVASVRYAASVGNSCVHTDMSASEWEALSSFPDALARLTARMTKALGLDDPEEAQWELIN